MLDIFRPVPKRRSLRLKKKSGIVFKNVYGLNKILFYFSLLVTIFGIAFGIYLYEPLGRALVTYAFFSVEDSVQTKQNSPTPLVGYLPLPSVTPTKVSIDKNNTEYKVTIPKIHAEAQVVENVDIQSKKDYMSALAENRIAEALGSGKPGGGKGKSIYLFAHSTEQSLMAVRKNAVFYLLDQLKNDDSIQINYKGNTYFYKMYDRKIISATDTQYFDYKDPEKEVLILQTCWPLGTNWKRLLVFAQKID